MFIYVLVCGLFTFGNAEQWFNHNFHQYFLGTEANNFIDAQMKCHGMSSNLAVIWNGQIQSFIRSKANNINSYYIGMTRMNRNSEEFVWVDDSPVSYTKWSKGEPNNFQNSSENCVLMTVQRNYLWNDNSCSIRAGYVCQRLISITRLISGKMVTTSEKPTSFSTTNATNKTEQRQNNNIFLYVISISTAVVVIIMVILIVVLLYGKRSNENNVPAITQSLNMRNKSVDEKDVAYHMYDSVYSPSLPQLEPRFYVQPGKCSDIPSYIYVGKSNETYVNILETHQTPTSNSLDKDGYAIIS